VSRRPNRQEAEWSTVSASAVVDFESADEEAHRARVPPIAGRAGQRFVRRPYHRAPQKRVCVAWRIALMRLLETVPLLRRRRGTDA